MILIAVCPLLLITCSLDNNNNKPDEEIITTVYKENEIPGTFWAQNNSTKEFYQVNAQLLAENSRVKVWTEKGNGVTGATAKKIADEYAKVIYVKMMNTFGYRILEPTLGIVNTMEIAHYLVTGKTKDAKLTILLLDIKDGYNKEGDPYVGGYFYAVDFFDNETLKEYPQYSNIKSNELDMIYIDTYPSDPTSASTYETLAHEMQHLMNFTSSNIFRETIMDTWIDEGLSGAAEWVYSGKHPEIRWKYYNADPSELIAKGNNFYIWDNHNENQLANLDDYATVYLFFQYLRLQAGNSGKIYNDIHISKYPDYQAVITANSINSSHKNNWSLLLRDWHAANYTNNTSGLYGYKNDPVLKDVKAPMFKGGTTVSLSPGEGVYSKTNTAEPVPAASGTIRYAGLGSSGTTPNVTTGFVNGARLTYNVDTNIKGSSASGSTTGIAPSADVSIAGGRSISQSGLYKFTGPFKVDAGYFSRRTKNGSMPDDQIKYIFSKSRSIDKENSMIKFDTSTVERVHIDE